LTQWRKQQRVAPAGGGKMARAARIVAKRASVVAGRDVISW